MTSFSTAFVMVGPSGVGSFHDRLWRVSPNTAQLVEGGTNGPYFLLGSGDDEFVFHIEDFDSDSVMRAVVLLTTLLVGEEQTIGLLRASENLIKTEAGERVAPYWELADDVLQSLTKRLAPICRIGIVRLGTTSALTTEVIALMRLSGLDVAEFDDIETLQSRTIA